MDEPDPEEKGNRRRGGPRRSKPNAVDATKRVSITARSIRREILANLQMNLDLDASGSIALPGDVGVINEDYFHSLSPNRQDAMESLVEPTHSVQFYLTTESVEKLRRATPTSEDPYPVLELCMILPSMRSKKFRAVDSLVPVVGQELGFALNSDAQWPLNGRKGVVLETTYLGARHAGRRMVGVKLGLQ